MKMQRATLAAKARQKLRVDEMTRAERAVSVSTLHGTETRDHNTCLSLRGKVIDDEQRAFGTELAVVKTYRVPRVVYSNNWMGPNRSQEAVFIKGVMLRWKQYLPVLGQSS